MHRRPLADRFWEKVNKTDTCWLWTAYIHKRTGYGRIGPGGRAQPRDAHVVSWEMANGPVPPGLELDHLCRVRHCVRPSHLDPVPHIVNARRGKNAEVARAKQLAKTHCPQGHAYAGTNLIVTKDGARRCRICRNRQTQKSRAVTTLIHC